MSLARAIVAGCALALLPATGHAQAATKRPLRILVGTVPGSPADVQIRLLLPFMTELLAQALIVDNRAGANGALAAEITARSAPDGHTLVVGDSGTHAVNASLYAKPAYDPVRDFAPISQLSTTGFVVTAHPRLPGTTIQELAAHAQRQPGKLKVGISAPTGEIAGDALWARLGIKLAKVRDKDGAPPTLALSGGEVDLALLLPPLARPHVHAGRLKAYGITGADRCSILPEVPTLLEQGVTDYEFAFWHGLFAPAGTPPEVVGAVQKAVAQALQQPEVRMRYDQLGLAVVGSTPEEFGALVKQDVAKLRKLVSDTGIPRR